jgi:polyribonucleotide nucleotidyltransferase
LIIQNVKKQIADKFETGLRNAFKEIDKKKRSTAISEIETQCKEMFAEDENVSENQAMAQLKSLEKDIVRTAILKDKKRIDGRGLADVRQIQCEVGVFQEHMALLYLQEEKPKL